MSNYRCICLYLFQPCLNASISFFFNYNSICWIGKNLLQIQFINAAIYKYGTNRQTNKIVFKMRLPVYNKPHHIIMDVYCYLFHIKYYSMTKKTKNPKTCPIRFCFTIRFICYIGIHSVTIRINHNTNCIVYI